MSRRSPCDILLITWKCCHAARIMSVGHGGQVLLSQTTRDLVEHDLPAGVSLRDLGAHRLKDLQQKSHLAVGMHPLGLAFWRLLVHDIHRNLFSGFSIA